MIHKHLQDVLNANSLVLAKVKLLELLQCEVLVVQGVVDEGFYDIFQDFNDFFIEGCSADWLLDLERRVVLAVFTHALLLSFLQQFRAVDLENLDFLLKVVDIFADDLKCFLPLSFVLNLDLNE